NDGTIPPRDYNRVRHRRSATSTPTALGERCLPAPSTPHLKGEVKNRLRTTTSSRRAVSPGSLQPFTQRGGLHESVTHDNDVVDIRNVEVEVYHVFPKDSADPPSGRVPLRVNSPADVEIDTATRDGSLGTLAFTASLQNPSFSVLNTVVNGINPVPHNVTRGE